MLKVHLSQGLTPAWPVTAVLYGGVWTSIWAAIKIMEQCFNVMKVYKKWTSDVVNPPVMILKGPSEKFSSVPLCFPAKNSKYLVYFTMDFFHRMFQSPAPFSSCWFELTSCRLTVSSAQACIPVCMLQPPATVSPSSSSYRAHRGHALTLIFKGD